MTLRLALCGVLLGMTALSGSVLAQSQNPLETRLSRIEREMQTLSRSVYKGDVPPPQISTSDPQQAAAIETRLNQIEEQIRTLTGMVEEANYKLRQLESNAGNTTAAAPTPANNDNGSYPSAYDMDKTSVQTETTAPAAPATAANQPYQLGTISTNSSSPAGLYDQAFSYLQRNDYAAAQKGFEDFIKTYPDDTLVANAKYWLGETFYARGDYAGASRAFAIAYKDFPSGQKAPDSLLKLAMSLKQQGMGDEACLTLAEIGKQFPDAPALVKTKAEEEKQSYSCK